MGEEPGSGKAWAEATGKAIDATRELGGFVSRVFGGTAEEGVGIIEDKVKYARWRRQLDLVEKAQAEMEARGLREANRPVPFNVVIPAIEFASFEEDDYLQTKWAQLLVNAADEGFEEGVKRSFVNILSQLDPFDAVLLDKIYSEVDIEQDREVFTTFLPTKLYFWRPDREDIRPSPEVEVSIGNLARLGCVTSAIAFGGVAMFSAVHPTHLGRHFYAACSSPLTE